jgi:hypothetical protein
MEQTNTKGKSMNTPLIVKTGEHTVKVLYTCGHYSHDGKSNSGSWIDFPDEPEHCEICDKEVQIHLGLQAQLFEFSVNGTPIDIYAS